jgi:hypothetical protein
MLWMLFKVFGHDCLKLPRVYPFLKRVFDIDISVCPLCGGTLRVIADVTDPDAIQTILAHLKQRAPPDAVRRQRPGQGPQNDLFTAI